MKLRKISILFLLVLGISFIIVSVTPVNVYAGAPPTGKELKDLLSHSDEKTQKDKDPHLGSLYPNLYFHCDKYFNCDENSNSNAYNNSHKNFHKNFHSHFGSNHGYPDLHCHSGICTQE